MPERFLRFTDQQILAARPSRNRVDARTAYAFLVEPECNARGRVIDVATLFLTNRECPFRCLMCDLWKNTLVASVAPGDIPHQIRLALRQLPPAREIKLYNSGNFFDRRAIPVDDHEAIANLVRGFDTVIVENHPRLCDAMCLRFRDQVAPARLEVALGLETCHPRVLASLNKAMTLDDFERATALLHKAGIRTRAFVLLKPPFLDEAEGLAWASRSINYAFTLGVDCVSVVPTRAGNGIMEQLQERGQFAPPDGATMERVLETGLQMRAGRVFVDLWDAERFFRCDACRVRRVERLRAMNLCQKVLPAVQCEVCMA